MSDRRRKVGRKATDLEQQQGLEDLFLKMAAPGKAAVSGRTRGPGSSFGLPFKFVNRADQSVWVLSVDGAGQLVVTSPAGTVSVLGAP